MKTETITIGVRDRVLWIGSEAYPLRNIARVSTAQIVYRKGRAIGRFLGLFFLWLFIGVFALVALFAGGVLQTDEQTNKALAAFGVLFAVIVLVLLIRLLSVLTRRGLWALIIETAGTSHRALVSRDRPLLDGLVRQIVAAINNPTITFSQTITNIVAGNQYNNTGSGTQYNASGNATGRIG